MDKLYMDILSLFDDIPSLPIKTVKERVPDTTLYDIWTLVYRKCYLSVRHDSPNILEITLNGRASLAKAQREGVEVGELTAARAEIARLIAVLEASERANAELTEKLKIADAGWAECMGSGRNPWSTAQEFKRRQNDIRKRYRGE